MTDPITVLRQAAEQMTHSVSATVPERMATFHAAEILRAFEQEHKVTFVAVDRDALAALHRAREKAVDSAGMIAISPRLVWPLVNAVDALGVL